MEKIMFIGAGPGAPDLLTLRAKRLIEEADVIIYAGSLVNPQILAFAKKDARITDSASLTLPELADIMEEAAEADKKTVRLHTGDPSLYGAVREQMRELDRRGVPYEVVPGVSSFLAAAASLRREYTLPGVSQTVILTRMEGRTAVPEKESIESLAAHQASMVVFLSVAGIDALTARLMEGGYPPDTPAAVVFKASWEEEKKVLGTLGDLALKVREAKIEKTALVLVGKFLTDEFENSRLYDPAFTHGYREGKDKGKPVYHAMRLMIQGTMSSAGKSFVTAALCRIFAQDGLSVSPFKSQNMALNSAVTSEGLEIGRAQAMEAEAAGLKPCVNMNPILLKPTSDRGSQVIVRGEVTGDQTAAEYYENKAALIPVIRRSFEELAGVYDVVVIEGAGSPAEINLRENDIVNMGMAKIADAPVLLVADIDRGGVFAQIVGTVELLTPEERARVKGIIINKFRGDVTLLRSGIDAVQKRLGIPVLGVIPMIAVDLDDEDSLAPRLAKKREGEAPPITGAKGEKTEKILDIAVVRLPHMANFTDFSVLERLRTVSFCYAENAPELGEPDLCILPGTKNTVDDLDWLTETGLAARLKELMEGGHTLFMGICGGFQMLGERLCDPEGVEGAAGREREGLSFLPVRTVFEAGKTRTLISGTLTVRAKQLLAPDLPDEAVEGYEIHMGRTSRLSSAGTPAFLLSDGREDGFVRDDGCVFGTYLHGLFDNAAFTVSLLKNLAEKKGAAFTEEMPDSLLYKNAQYNKLADVVRRSLDMDAVYRILDESRDAGSGA